MSATNPQEYLRPFLREKWRYSSVHPNPLPDYLAREKRLSCRKCHAPETNSSGGGAINPIASKPAEAQNGAMLQRCCWSCAPRHTARLRRRNRSGDRHTPRITIEV